MMKRRAGCEVKTAYTFRVMSRWRCTLYGEDVSSRNDITLRHANPDLGSGWLQKTTLGLILRCEFSTSLAAYCTDQECRQQFAAVSLDALVIDLVRRRPSHPSGTAGPKDLGLLSLGGERSLNKSMIILSHFEMSLSSVPVTGMSVASKVSLAFVSRILHVTGSHLSEVQPTEVRADFLHLPEDLELVPAA